MMPTTFVEKAAEIDGVKLGTDAMIASGMQPEFAAHLQLQNQALGISTILRAGSPPVYNQKRGPKTGLNLTKTSNQGFFKGSLAAEEQFTRIDTKTGKPKGHDKKDADHLKLNIKDPNYQHTVALPITMLDILKEINCGDLEVLGYDAEKQRLSLGYCKNKGNPNFKGQFLIDLAAGEEKPIFYSRPWDHPSAQEGWDDEKKIIHKPKSLNKVPDDVYQQAFNKIFTVKYVEHKKPNISDDEIKEAKVFANTPRLASDLLEAIHQIFPEKDQLFQENENMASILNKLTPEEIKQVYDGVGLVTTGDWDGMALGYSHALATGFPAEKMQVYNTFAPGEEGVEEKYKLMKATIDYFNHLKNLPTLNTEESKKFNNLLDQIGNVENLFNDFILSRAGCITPHEFLYQQLINYSYRDKLNETYGNTESQKMIQQSINEVLESVKRNPEQLNNTNTLLDQGLKAYRRHSSVPGRERNSSWAGADEEYLTTHLKIAVQVANKNPNQDYIVPNISHDHNVHDLFQHGFDMRNPYGSNLEGPWVMVTDGGVTLYGDQQEQLVEVLLIPGFLEKNIITVSHGADMKAGWDRVIARQIELQQAIPEKTKEVYDKYLKTPDINVVKQYQNVVASIIPHEQKVVVDEHRKNKP